jgi:hypothetical protein
MSETQAIQQHYHPRVCELAKLFSNKMDNKPRLDLGDYLDETFETVSKNSGRNESINSKHDS